MDIEKRLKALQDDPDNTPQLCREEIGEIRIAFLLLEETKRSNRRLIERLIRIGDILPKTKDGAFITGQPLYVQNHSGEIVKCDTYNFGPNIYVENPEADYDFYRPEDFSVTPKSEDSNHEQTIGNRT